MGFHRDLWLSAEPARLPGTIEPRKPLAGLSAGKRTLALVVAAFDGAHVDWRYGDLRFRRKSARASGTCHWLAGLHVDDDHSGKLLGLDHKGMVQGAFG